MKMVNALPVIRQTVREMSDTVSVADWISKTGKNSTYAVEAGSPYKTPQFL